MGRQLPSSTKVPLLLGTLCDFAISSGRSKWVKHLRIYDSRVAAASTATVKKYVPVMRALLDERFRSGKIDFASLSARYANHLVPREAECLISNRSKLVVEALNSFFRHWHESRALQADLARTVLPVVRLNLFGLARSLASEQVKAISTGCDRDRLSGRRNYTILPLLARMRLRTAEVTALTLDGLDRNEEVITLPVEGQRHEPTLLADEIREALAIR